MDRSERLLGWSEPLVGWLDALAYALTGGLLAVAVAVVVGLLSGGGLVTAKVLLFLGGFAIMAVATATLWPSDLDSGSGGGASTGAGGSSGSDVSIPEDSLSSRVGRGLDAVPPLRWVPTPPPARRRSTGTKLFLLSGAVLAASYAMETVFGVA